MSKDRDVAGNARESTLRAQEVLLKIGGRLMSFEALADRWFEDGYEFKALKIKFPSDERAGYLLVLTAESGAGPVVAFQDGSELHEALIGLINRLQNKTVKFKEDEYA